MPRSKREKLVSLTKTEKKGRPVKAALMSAVQENADKWKYIWVFQVGHMRNSALKEVRNQWKGTGRMFFGRTAVMAKALSEDERKQALAKKLKGSVGLFFTDTLPQEVQDWFQSYSKPDFARAGNLAPREVTLPIGPILQYGEPFPSSMDPQLRKLGLTTKLERGVPTLLTPHLICKKGSKLTPEQAQLLKLIGDQMAIFKVRLVGRWDSDEGYVEVEGLSSELEENAAAEDGEDGVEEMET